MMLSALRPHRHRQQGAALLGALGGLLLACALFLAVAAPSLAPFRPTETDLRQKNLPPCWETGGNARHVLGTDAAGRDVASRLVWGARVSVSAGVAASLLGACLGCTLGLCAGFSDGLIRRAVSWLIDVQSAFPLMLLAIFLLDVLGSGFGPMVVVLTLATWVKVARVVRRHVRRLRAQDFVLAAQAAGIGLSRLLRRYILPPLLPPVAAAGSYALAQAILTQSALGFLGVDAGALTPSWGGMLAPGPADPHTAWWTTTFPGIAISLTVLGAALVGDWLASRQDQGFP